MKRKKPGRFLNQAFFTALSRYKRQFAHIVEKIFNAIPDISSTRIWYPFDQKGIFYLTGIDPNPILSFNETDLVSGTISISGIIEITLLENFFFVKKKIDAGCKFRRDIDWCAASPFFAH